jgi:hypothetical protein
VSLFLNIQNHQSLLGEDRFLHQKHPVVGIGSLPLVILFCFQSDHEDLVENSAVGGLQNLEVRSKPLPDNLPELLLSVTTEFGPPILYAKTGRASTLRLLVGTTRNKAGEFFH